MFSIPFQVEKSVTINKDTSDVFSSVADYSTWPHWSAAMGCSRSKHKLNKALPMYEVYSNDPHDVAEEELQVEIYVPVKR